MLAGRLFAALIGTAGATHGELSDVPAQTTIVPL